MSKSLMFFSILLVSITVAACNFESDPSTPTLSGIIEEPVIPLPEQTGTQLPTSSPSPSPTETEAEQVAMVDTNTPTPSPIPSATSLPSPTPGPWEYTIQPEDTLLFIIQQPPFNYSIGDRAVIDEIVRLNDTMSSPDFLPPAGTVILIPRPTAAPLPANVPTADPEQVSTVEQTKPNLTIDPEGVVIVPPDRPNVTPPPMRPNKGLQAGSYVGCHYVRSNETVAGIIEQYAGLTLDIFSRLNADLNYSGCNFNIPSGGPLCNPTIRENACVNVVLPTPTPTLSPTPSGSETPTPTPTYIAPQVISPLNGSIVSGGVLTLSWVSVGRLQENETYLIQYSDITGEETRAFTTRATSFRLPASLIPSDGQTHSINWSVSVAYQNADGLYVPVGGGSGRIYRFEWQSR